MADIKPCNILLIDGFSLLYRAYYGYPPNLTTPSGTPINAVYGFVTLMLNNQLRGCIGCITSFDPLHKTIPYYAVQSATQDHRFSPLTLAELPNVDIKLSVLTPPSPIGSINEIVLGTHGVIFSYLSFKSVFLPEVATEQGWDLETTLRHLASFGIVKCTGVFGF